MWAITHFVVHAHRRSHHSTKMEWAFLQTVLILCGCFWNDDLDLTLRRFHSLAFAHGVFVHYFWTNVVPLLEISVSGNLVTLTTDYQIPAILELLSGRYRILVDP